MSEHQYLSGLQYLRGNGDLSERANLPEQPDVARFLNLRGNRDLSGNVHVSRHVDMPRVRNLRRHDDLSRIANLRGQRNLSRLYDMLRYVHLRSGLRHPYDAGFPQLRRLGIL